jgi:hypothetical protein
MHSWHAWGQILPFTVMGANFNVHVFHFTVKSLFDESLGKGFF